MFDNVGVDVGVGVGVFMGVEDYVVVVMELEFGNVDVYGEVEFDVDMEEDDYLVGVFGF